VYTIVTASQTLAVGNKITYLQVGIGMSATMIVHHHFLQTVLAEINSVISVDQLSQRYAF
jgi:hypothetical protein